MQWKGERSRHLLPIADEPLVMRTQRICSEFGQPATIVTDVPQVQEVAQRYFNPGRNRWIYDTIRNTEELWGRDDTRTPEVQEDVSLDGEIWSSGPDVCAGRAARAHPEMPEPGLGRS